MSEKILAVVIAGFCLGPGYDPSDVYPGDQVELDPHIFRLEYDRGRIKPVKPEEEEPSPAAVLEQARQELLEQIATAPDHASLEALLSEDPEIVAAYEKRLEELSEPDH